MKYIKKSVSVFLSVILIALSCQTASFAKSVEYTLNISASLMSEFGDAVDYFQKTVTAVYGEAFAISDKETNCVKMEKSSGELDYSVSFNEKDGSVTLRAGCGEGMFRAVCAMLSAVCAENSGEFILNDSVNYSYVHSEDSTDNSSLIKYEGDSQKLVSSWADGVLRSPSWLDSLVMVEVRPDTASLGGTFADCCDLLDFYASVGVNGIWLTPIYDKGTEGNGYSNYGPHTVDPRLSGKEDYDEGWQEVRKFVDYAHSKGIYIFLDVITWGAVYNAPLITEHPDWFSGEAWGNAAFDWSNNEFREWFVSTLVENILITGADGYRCDCEPNYTGYDIYGEVRRRLAEKKKYIAIISEDTSTRKSVYDFEQDGVLDYASMDRAALYSNPVNFFTDGYLNIVDSVKTGKGIGSYSKNNKKLKRGKSRYYTNCITNHDYQRRDVCGNRLKIGYSAILAPFIPLWYMGDEFNCKNVRAVQYDIPVDYSESEIPANAFFLEDVKKMLNIRRTYREIFDTHTLNHRNSNICEVTAEGFDSLQNYARYADNKAVLVIANNNPDTVSGTVKIPFKKCGINGYKTYAATDLLTGRVILTGTKDEIDGFTAAVPYQHMGIYLVEGIDENRCRGLNLSSAAVGFSECCLSLFIKIMSLFN